MHCDHISLHCHHIAICFQSILFLCKLHVLIRVLFSICYIEKRHGLPSTFMLQKKIAIFVQELEVLSKYLNLVQDYDCVKLHLHHDNVICASLAIVPFWVINRSKLSNIFCITLHLHCDPKFSLYILISFKVTLYCIWK